MQPKNRILSALWFFQIVNYIDRVAISFAAPAIMASLAMTHESFGLVLSAFSVGYMIGQIPGGLLADRWGVRPLLIVAPLFWALLTGITGLVSGLAGFVAVRLLFGLSEGLSNTCAYKAIGDNFDSKERSSAVGTWATALAIAPMIAGPAVGFLLTATSWRWVFVILAVPALIASAVNFALVPAAKNTPQERARHVDAGLVSILRTPSLWIIGGSYFCFNIAYWGYVGWMPSYLSSAHHIDIKHLGLLGAVPYASALIGLILAGRLARTVLYHYRAQMLALFYLGAAGALYLAYSAPTLAGSLAGLSATAFFLYGSLSCFGAIVLELAPAQGRATYPAAVTTLGQLGGAMAPWIIGMLVSTTGNFAWGFALMAVALVLSAILLTALVPTIAARISPTPAPDGVH